MVKSNQQAGNFTRTAVSISDKATSKKKTDSLIKEARDDHVLCSPGWLDVGKRTETRLQTRMAVGCSVSCLGGLGNESEVE